MKKNIITIQQNEYAPEMVEITLRGKKIYSYIDDIEKIKIDTYKLYTLNNYKEKIKYIRQQLTQKRINIAELCEIGILTNNDKIITTKRFNCNTFTLKALKKLNYKLKTCKVL